MSLMLIWGIVMQYMLYIWGHTATFDNDTQKTKHFDVAISTFDFFCVGFVSKSSIIISYYCCDVCLDFVALKKTIVDYIFVLKTHDEKKMISNVAVSFLSKFPSNSFDIETKVAVSPLYLVIFSNILTRHFKRLIKMQNKFQNEKSI